MNLLKLGSHQTFSLEWIEFYLLTLVQLYVIQSLNFKFCVFHKILNLYLTYLRVLKITNKSFNLKICDQYIF